MESEEDPEAIERIKRYKERFDKPNCCYCNKKLSRRDRVSDCFPILSLGKNGRPVESYDVTSLYQARKATGLSLCSLINAAKKRNFKITRRKDKKEFLISWSVIHDDCFELRKAKEEKKNERRI